jgi:hypothetical protein
VRGLGLASAMPLDPPVMTATLPSSFPMALPFKLCLCSSGEDPEELEMGSPASGGQSGSAHISGANSIRLDIDMSYDVAGLTAVRWVSHGLQKAPRAVPDRTMIDWDDVRYFLAVARGGSVRAAAERLGVNHRPCCGASPSSRSASGRTCSKSCLRVTA